MGLAFASSLSWKQAGQVAGGVERFLDLKGRGRIRVFELEGAPTLMLLHGLAAPGPLNWFTAFPELAERYRVVAVDHRGHGRGIPTRRFRLKDCADDAVADALGIQKFIAVGLCLLRTPSMAQSLVFPYSGSS
jgi:pimeloyl-ACP methyl ester carboxylesterase